MFFLCFFLWENIGAFRMQSTAELLNSFLIGFRLCVSGGEANKVGFRNSTGHWIQKLEIQKLHVGFRNYPWDSETISSDSETTTSDSETILSDSETISSDSETISSDSETLGIQKLLHGSEPCSLGLVQCCFSASLGLLVRWQIWCQIHSNIMHTWDTDKSNDQVMMSFNLSWRGTQSTPCGQYIGRKFHSTYLHDGSKLPPTVSNTLMGIVT